MEKDFNFHYQEGLNGLEELKYLADKELSPIIDRITHYLIQLKESHAQERDLDNLSSLKELLLMRIQSLIKNKFMNSKRLTALSCRPLFQQINGESWDALLRFLPKILDFLEFLQVYDALEVTIYDDRLEIHSRWDRGSVDLENGQKIADQMIKEVLASQNFLTIDCRQEEIILLFFFAIKGQNYFSAEIAQTQVALPEHYFHYLLSTPYPQIKSLGRDMTIELMDDFSFVFNPLSLAVLLQHQYKNSEFMQMKKIFYFPFLFKSISLIIPIKGKILPIDGLNMNDHHEDDLGKRILYSDHGIDLRGPEVESYLYFDIFKDLP